MKLLRHIPNALTCGNLVSGCYGILFATTYQLEAAAYCVWAACVFDFFDGFAARLLNVSSTIGKELDSLADMVSFGVLPSLVMYTHLTSAVHDPRLAYAAFLLAVFSALRLAKFNVDEKQHDSFIGVPTPANALFITSLVFLPSPLIQWIANDNFLLLITLLFSLLLVAPFKLIALKFKDFTWKSNNLRYVLVILSLMALIMLKQSAIPFIILFYILLSLLTCIIAAKEKR